MENRKSKTSQNNHKGLITCLKIFAVIFLFVFILLLGWIAGIIWLIFFRKNMASDPDKQKKYTIGISIASALSFIFFIYTVITAPPSPTSLVLSTTSEHQILDIDSDYIINIEYEPEGASLSSVRYIVDNSKCAKITSDADNPSILILHTTGEGTINVTATKNDVTSNTLSFEIVDSERIEREKNEAEEKQRLEEERLAAEASKQAEEERLAAEASKQAEEERLAAEASKQAEEERLAAEASKQAEEERLAAEASNQTTPETSSSPTSNTTNSTMVWVDDTAKRYHKKNGCGMDNAYQVTLEEAINMGKTPCGRCYK